MSFRFGLGILPVECVLCHFMCFVKHFYQVLDCRMSGFDENLSWILGVHSFLCGF